jgi:hypothetical protein
MINDATRGPLFTCPRYQSLVDAMARLSARASIPGSVFIEKDHIHIEVDRFQNGLAVAAIYDDTTGEETLLQQYKRK